MKRIFFISLTLMLLITWWSGWNVGFHSDELDMNNYGKSNLDYYLSVGKNVSFLGGHQQQGVVVDSMLKYYGPAFELIAAGFNRITGIDKGQNEFNVRHIFAQLFGMLTLLFGGLIARRFAGWGAAVLAVWLAFLSPSFMGHFYFNTKDIPFCAGYMATVYYTICFLDTLPDPGWDTAVRLMLSFYFAVNTRIGGLVLAAYLLLFLGIFLLTKKELRESLSTSFKGVGTKVAYILGVAMILVVVTWPFLLTSPVQHLGDALNVVTKFPAIVKVNFDGTQINSTDVPANYLSRAMLYTMPVAVLVLFVAGIILLFLKRSRYDWRLTLLLLCSIFFPPVYAIVTHVSLYSGWRHFLFIYPGICIVAAVGVWELIGMVPKPAMKIAAGVLVLAGFIKPIVWSVKNHPYEYCYFNELSGGFKNVFYSYDTDYWQISVKKSVDWLMDHEHLSESKDSVTIVCNASIFARYYIGRQYPSAKVKVMPSGATGRNTLFWNYAVLNSLFLKPTYLEHYYPFPMAVYSENIDGVPVTSVIKDLTRLDYQGFDAFKKGRYELADSLYSAYFKANPVHNPGIDAYLSVIKAALNQNDVAINLANGCLEAGVSANINYHAQCGLGLALANKRQYADAVEILKTAVAAMPGDALAKNILNQVYLVIRSQKEQAAAPQPK